MQGTKVGLIVMKDGKGKKKDVVEVDNVEDGMEERATRGRTKGKGFSLFINQVVLTRQERRTNWRRRQMTIQKCLRAARNSTPCSE